MRQRIAKLSAAALILAVGTAGALVGRQASSAENKPFANVNVPEGHRSYRHNGHFTTSLELPAGSAFPATFTVTATLTTATKTQDWPVYCQRVGKGGRKLIVVLVAQHPDGVKSKSLIAGTGTILVQTTDPGGNTTTGPPIPVEPIDTDPCP